MAAAGLSRAALAREPAGRLWGAGLGNTTHYRIIGARVRVSPESVAVDFVALDRRVLYGYTLD